MSAGYLFRYTSLDGVTGFGNSSSVALQREGQMLTMRTVATITAAAFMSACSTVPPASQLDYSLVDPAGVDMAQYQRDFADCAQLANQASVANTAATGAAIMAGVGSVIGALLGAAICGHSCARQGALIGAASGVSSGATSGAAAAITDQQVTLRNCLTGRGYRVIR